MPAFLLYWLMQISFMCFLIAKYLYIISYSYSTPAVLICLVNLPIEDVLNQKGIFRNLYLPKGV